ncbi:DUF423 domain-containing protein [Kordiimonas pumila]|uniref:DUF423 domain-containing protein n=1 Tax=Kordiimonas pumila TaxID=2161677 RepID=A0ABV7D9B1_9PROT|nr:DUF423 domain-containing protein [Kordiimonas pumila]
MKAPSIIAVAGVSGFLATVLAASGSHSFNLTGAEAGFFQQANEFHFYHTFALVATAVLAKWGKERTATTAALMFIAGILCFSGSLYIRAIMGPGSLGSFHWVTPVGGMLLMVGWLAMAIGSTRNT